MVALLYLKHAHGQSDESVVERWAQDVYFQFFSGNEYFEARLPCDATQMGRFRRVLGEAGVEQLLKTTMEAAVSMKAIKPIGHAKYDNGMDRCWLKGSEGDALHAVLCAAGFNIRWLMRAIVHLDLAATLLCLRWLTALSRCSCLAPHRRQPHQNPASPSTAGTAPQRAALQLRNSQGRLFADKL